MAEQTIYNIAEQMLKERLISDYDVDTEIVSVPPSESVYVYPNGDYFLFVHAFSDRPLNGKIISGDNALRINSKTMSSSMFKHKMFHAAMHIINYDTVEDLSIEVLRITPVS